jgi:hypothetical protein
MTEVVVERPFIDEKRPAKGGPFLASGPATVPIPFPCLRASVSKSSKRQIGMRVAERSGTIREIETEKERV